MSRNSLTTLKSATSYPQRNDIPRPGDFELGSVESRAAARALLEEENSDDQRNRFRILVETMGRPATLQMPTCLRYWIATERKTTKRVVMELIKVDGIYSAEELEQWIRRIPIDGKTHSMPKSGDFNL
jgi:hypothetical protein